MPTLLLRCCGPQQSWGAQSRFFDRDTEREPTKSGIVGLLCSALGWPRDRDVSALAALRMGVRVDHEGRVERDFHTVAPSGGIRKAQGGLEWHPVVTGRYYLAGADFLVGLEGPDRVLLEELDAALQRPHWQLYLGRKSFVPAVPVCLPGGGVRDASLEEALFAEPWPLQPKAWLLPSTEKERMLRFVIEDPSMVATGGRVLMDQPLGAAFANRTFGPRLVTVMLRTKRAEGAE